MLLFQDVLAETLRRANVRFVQCLLPRAGAGLCELTAYASGNNSPTAEELIDVPLLRAQVCITSDREVGTNTWRGKKKIMKILNGVFRKIVIGVNWVVYYYF